MTPIPRSFAKFMWPACVLTLVVLQATSACAQTSATQKATAHAPMSCVAEGWDAGAKNRQANQSMAALFAPAGTLRASINLGNPVLASVDPSTGKAVGVSVDLATQFARQLGVPLELVVVKSAGQSVINVDNHQADIGFFAVDPKRGEEISFTKPYVLIEGYYLVRDGSPIKSNEQVDQPGNTVAVGKGSAYDLFLTRELHHAQIVRIATSPTVVQEFLDQNLTVAAGVKQQLQENARQTSGLRILDQRFMVIRQAMGVPKNRGDTAAAYLAGFVECMKASGFVAASLVRHGIEGAKVPATGSE